MSFQQSIILKNVSYITPDAVHQLRNLFLVLGQKKMGLMGKNGVGKTTLLKLIVGELMPVAGSIQRAGTVAYCPQNYDYRVDETVIQFLGFAEKVSALENILAGSTDLHDFEVLDDDWAVKNRIHDQLSQFHLEHIPLRAKLSSLSGGERTRLLLAKVFLSDADVLILDEPTNNLDLRSREALYEAISVSKQGLLIVSHDRTLLNLMDSIAELTTKGLQIFGGNYDHYVEQKEILNASLQQRLGDAKKQIKQVETSIQKSREISERKQSNGRKQRGKGDQPKMLLDARKECSQQTQKMLAVKANKRIEDVKEQLETIREKIEIEEELDCDLATTYVPSHKMVLDIEQLSFRYKGQSEDLIHDLNLKIRGPERIAVMGENGSGKSTLFKLIRGELAPLQGSIKVGIDRISYLDQHGALLDPMQSVLDNFRQCNPSVPITEAYRILAHFLFRHDKAKKIVYQLSGGERVRASLACELMSEKPPQLLILDEPVNHLDLESIRSIESALQNYKGAILVVSHDQTFLAHIKVDGILEMGK